MKHGNPTHFYGRPKKQDGCLNPRLPQARHGDWILSCFHVLRFQLPWTSFYMRSDSGSFTESVYGFRGVPAKGSNAFPALDQFANLCLPCRAAWSARLKMGSSSSIFWRRSWAKRSRTFRVMFQMNPPQLISSVDGQNLHDLETMGSQCLLESSAQGFLGAKQYGCVAVAPLATGSECKYRLHTGFLLG